MENYKKLSRIFLNLGIILQFITIFFSMFIVFTDFKYYISFPKLIFIVILGFIFYFLYGYFSVISTKVEKNKYKLVRESIFLYFILYSTVLFIVFFLKSAMGLYYSSDDYIVFLRNNFNLIPFHTIKFYFAGFYKGTIGLNSLFFNIIGNLIIFMPLAISLYCLFPKYRILKNYIKILSFIIISVEIMQILTKTGYMDIDDFILNLLGCIIVFYFISNKYIKNLLKRYYIL